VDVCNLDNNHATDFGTTGLVETRSTLANAAIA
jgi:poly-gamma-glutamate capsule biosynthesis protein CapA/YwtB (metallophosphatase superfamily)